MSNVKTTTMHCEETNATIVVPIARAPSTYLADIPLQLAIAAHNGTSHTPEKRGDQEIQSYANTLASDYGGLMRYATTDEKRATLEAEFARYRSGYRTRYMARLLSMSRCMSTMITGGSNFPTRRNRKRSDSADKRVNELIDYREGALIAIRRKLTPELAPIMAGDDDAISRLEAKIASAWALQVFMRAANAAIRSHAKGGADAQIAALVALELPSGKHLAPSVAAELLKPDFAGRTGYADYNLTNNNANIRRLKARLAEISVAKATPAVETAGSLAKVEDCPADNRVRLFFPGKPDSETRSRLKSSGFRWAPSLGCWQAYRNHRTLATAKREAGEVEVPTAPVEPCAAVQNGMEQCDPDHMARGVACLTCDPRTAEERGTLSVPFDVSDTVPWSG